jgi:hypothetical protein
MCIADNVTSWCEVIGELSGVCTDFSPGDYLGN